MILDKLFKSKLKVPLQLHTRENTDGFRQEKIELFVALT